jgi:hypothetical protein
VKVEMMWHRRETRRPTENTKPNLPTRSNLPTHPILCTALLARMGSIENRKIAGLTPIVNVRYF